MEPLFENACVWTKKAIRQMYYRVYRNWIITILVIVALNLVSIILNSLYSGIPVLRLMLEHSLLVVYALAVFFALKPWINSAVMYRRYFSLYRAEQKTVLRFYEDRFTQSGIRSSGETTFEYVQICRVMETRDLLLLKLKGKWVLLLDKNGFTRGDPSSLKAFLRERTGTGGWTPPTGE